MIDLKRIGAGKELIKKVYSKMNPPDVVRKQQEKIKKTHICTKTKDNK